MGDPGSSANGMGQGGRGVAGYKRRWELGILYFIGRKRLPLGQYITNLTFVAYLTLFPNRRSVQVERALLLTFQIP